MSESSEAVLTASEWPRSAAHTVLDDRGAGLLAAALSLVSDDLAAADRELAVLLRSSVASIPEIGGELAFAGGKRFRPLLALLAAAAAGYREPARITVAAVGELLHTATLLHDDVIDHGEFRRGRPTARLRHGNGMAVLVGDYCLARALQAIAATGQLHAVVTMSDAVTRMAEGEVAQLHACGDDTLDRTRYAMVIDRKTAALIGWCASVAGLPEPALHRPLERYGLELGFAFQIADDVLDYRGLGGKEPGQDLRDGKMTLPLILACEADPSLHARVRMALRAGAPMTPSTASAIFEAVLAGDGAARASAIAHRHAEKACDALSALPVSPARTALEQVAEYVVKRSR
ncbi:MAG TPA: polyprenyl synthetase family protein [Nannocystaceae bacterium]|nr:polyprenyl synthetase family protein [Nannocystaceae bacterium]